MDVKQFLFWLQNHRRLDLLMVLLEGGELTRNGELTWKLVKKELGKRGTPVSDGTFRTSCKELVNLGLAEQVPIGSEYSMKFKYKLTTEGILVANIVKQMTEDLEILTNPKFRIVLSDPRIQKLSQDLQQALVDDMKTALENRIPVLQKAT